MDGASPGRTRFVSRAALGDALGDALDGRALRIRLDLVDVLWQTGRRAAPAARSGGG